MRREGGREGEIGRAIKEERGGGGGRFKGRLGEKNEGREARWPQCQHLKADTAWTDQIMARSNNGPRMAKYGSNFIYF